MVPGELSADFHLLTSSTSACTVDVPFMTHIVEGQSGHLRCPLSRCKGISTGTSIRPA